MNRDDARGPLHVVVNPGAGAADCDSLCSRIRDACAAASRELDLLVVDAGADIAARAALAVQRASADGGVVVAAGGDGTLSAVAQAVLDSQRPYGVLPQGTFNYFGRAHGIPTDLDEALRILLEEPPQPVQVGEVDGRTFLVNASLGLHPQLLEDREAVTASLGRHRWVAAGAALVTLLRGAHVLMLRIESAGMTRDLSTPTLFVGNNALQLDSLGLADAADVAAGTLSAHVLKPVDRWQLLGLAVRGAFGRLGAAEPVNSFEFARLRVNKPPGLGRRRVKLALDGEVRHVSLPIEFRVSPTPLWLIRPARPVGTL